MTTRQIIPIYVYVGLMKPRKGSIPVTGNRKPGGPNNPTPIAKGRKIML